MSFFGVLVLIGVIMFLKNQNQGKKKTTGTTYRTTTTTSYRSTPGVDFSAYQTPSVKPRPAQVHRPEPAKQSSSNAGKEKKEQPKGAKALLVCALVFLVIGLMYLFDFADNPFMWNISAAVNALVFAGCSAGSFFARHRIKKRAGRLAKYLAVMGKDDCKSVSEIARATGETKERVRKDLEYLAQRGDFGETAYFDNGLDSLVISEEAAEKERRIRQDEKSTRKAKADREANTTEYMRIFEDMREAASGIKDTEISEKMLRLTELTGKILSAAEENPEKEKDIRRFMSYYLPQTQKLMKSYSTMERQGVATANIASTKERIGDILDNLITGYEQQLDRMFGSDAIDISSDIDVLETMLKQDGLNGDGSGIAMGGH